MTKKIINIFLIFIFTVIALNVSLYYTREVKADSGWDTSYSGGSSSSWSSGSSSSSWSSSSSSRSSGSSSRSSSYRSSTPHEFGIIDFFKIIYFFFIVSLPLIILLLLSKKQSVTSRKSIFKPLSDEEILNVDPSLNIEEFEKKVYEKFVIIQEAWMNFDYDTLRKELTDELFNMYKMELESLKIKGQKNIMKDFKLISSEITSIRINNNIESINVALNVTFKDYVVDENNNVVRGNISTTYNNEYLLTYIKTTKIEDNKCPKCGNKLTNTASSKCEYCGSTIVSDSYDFVLSKKTKVYQKNT